MQIALHFVRIISFMLFTVLLSLTRLRANYLQPGIYDKIAATDTKCKCSVNSLSLH